MDEAVANVMALSARRDPTEARARLLAELDREQDAAVRSVLLRGIGIAERADSLDASVDRLHGAIEAAQDAKRADLVAEATFTLAGTICLRGDVPSALRLLDDVSECASPDLARRVDFQRATILARADSAEALALFSRAIAYFEQTGDDWYLPAALANRSHVRLDRGDLVGARDDSLRARELFDAAGTTVSVAFLNHNLGRIAGRSGDVVSALDAFERAEQALVGLGIDPTEVHVNRCEVLLAAGLYDDAAAVAERMVGRMIESAHGLERAEALYSQCVALMGTGNLTMAHAVAVASTELFEQQGRVGWALRARLVAVACDLASDGREVRELGDVLEERGQWLAAASAWAVLSAHDPTAASDRLRRLRRGRIQLPWELRVSELLVRARARLAAGDEAAAMRLTRQGVVLGEQRRELLVAVDLRAAVSAQLAAITTLGLALRRRRSVWGVVNWVDRCRSPLSRPSLLRASGDDEARLRAELMEVQVAARDASAEDAMRLVVRQAGLQRQLIAARRRLSPAGQLERAEPVVLTRRHFRGWAVVQHHSVDGRLAAVVVDDGPAELVELGALIEVRRARERLDRCVRSAIGGDASALRDVDRHARTLASLVLPRLASNVPLLVAPTAELMSVPWQLLAWPEQPVVVTPSLQHWVRWSDRPMSVERVGLAGGGALRSAGEELVRVAALWADRQTACVSVATVSSVVNLLASCDVVHLAAHGLPHRSGRFARIVLADGDLTSFDLENVPRTPAVVVLAACNAGVIEALPGDEAAGLAAALFRSGTRAVVAAAAPVPDSAAMVEVSVALHERLAAGRPVSVALRDLRRDLADPVAQLVAGLLTCYGCQ